jgi:hypothetical protein
VRARAAVGPVEAADIAEEFDVTVAVAERACRLLTLRTGAPPPAC